MLHIVLFQPDIPNNTGNIGRLCAVAGARLHLIHPLGFEINDKHLRRAGMDYWRQLDVHEHADWQAFCDAPNGPKRLWLFSTKANNSFWDVQYADGDGLLFGKETVGTPTWLHETIGPQRSVRIDQPQVGLRSLNLASSAAIATYEALRQLRISPQPNISPA
jgi:tRNA (cytidine/uridine-2'-O-)-methyltransferase